MQALSSITILIKEARGIDLECYRPSFLERCISKRVGMTKCSDPGTYFTLLEKDSGEIDALIDVFKINVSWFYRNPINWEILKDSILPRLIENQLKLSKDIIRVWVAGCAKGEEPYTLALLLDEIIEKQNHKITPQIFATDIDTEALARAKQGVYSRDALCHLPFGLVDKYFTETNNTFQLRPKLKTNVHFTKFDLLDSKLQTPSNAVFTNFDMVLCQNVLIYYQDTIQKKMFSRLARAVSGNGYLILGESENLLGQNRNQFTKMSDLGSIYQKL